MPLNRLLQNLGQNEEPETPFHELSADEQAEILAEEKAERV
jgi:hypothetical protein